MSRPHFHDGEPANLEAAALDALTWLEIFQRADAVRSAYCGAPVDTQRDLRGKLDAAVLALRTHLGPNPEPVFTGTATDTDRGVPCLACGGSEVVDSGGVHPWGSPIDLPCPHCGPDEGGPTQ